MTGRPEAHTVALLSPVRSTPGFLWAWSNARCCRGVMRLRLGLNVRTPGRRIVDTSQVWPMGERVPGRATYGGGVSRILVVAAVASLAVTGCASSSLEPDARVACGWNEPDTPVVSAIDADADQLAQNVLLANTRLDAARRVAQIDPRFAPLVEALEETATFAQELTALSRSEIEQIPNSRWDFAKYAQATARDQCEQLAAVVASK